MFRYANLVEYLALVTLLLVAEKGMAFEKVDDGYLFEGDMVMSKGEIGAALNGKDPKSMLSVFYGLRNSQSAPWPKARVPYVFGSSITHPFRGFFGRAKKAILSAMYEWEKNTCIRFVQRTTEEDYIEFVVDGSRCYSFVGRIGGKQKLSIGFGCFFHSITLHEIGHALGFYHEQSRPDRDKYVTIVWSHIQRKHRSNFAKYSHGSIDSLGSPYDYSSVMHYKRRTFARWPWQTTIKPKRNGVSLGGGHLSKEDVKQANAFYKCLAR